MKQKVSTETHQHLSTMSKRLYFQEEESEGCYGKEYFHALMEEEGITEMKVFLAKPDIGGDGFWCSHFQEVGLKDDSGCGTDCKEYSPCNGKNGRCRFSKLCYIPTEEVILKQPIKKK